MEFNVENEEGFARIRINGSLTIYEASIIHDELKAVMETAEGLSLCLEGVTEFDLAGCQIIYSASKTIESIGGRFWIEKAPESVLEIGDRAGLNLRGFMKSEKEEDDVQTYHDGG